MPNEEDDIQDFVVKNDFFSDIKSYRENLPMYDLMTKINERSSLYLEFLAGAFIKETGLKASEVELVCFIGMNEIHWEYRKKHNAS